MGLEFRQLIGGQMAITCEQKKGWETPKIIIPEFTPKEKVEYTCELNYCSMRCFEYKGVRYGLIKAKLVQEETESQELTGTNSMGVAEVGLQALYSESDPDFQGKLTMNFLHALNKVSLDPEKQYKLKVLSKKSANCTNARGALMVNVQVKIIE
ncbi:hypothetical protein ISS03_02115 [Patescibacteria group bacterium]|nr:hypothetical protein [Patescibacteria group bacterium]